VDRQLRQPAKSDSLEVELTAPLSLRQENAGEENRVRKR
jgi:hypothetical protein